MSKEDSGEKQTALMTLLAEAPNSKLGAEVIITTLKHRQVMAHDGDERGVYDFYHLDEKGEMLRLYGGRVLDKDADDEGETLDLERLAAASERVTGALDNFKRVMAEVDQMPNGRMAIIHALQADGAFQL